MNLTPSGYKQVARDALKGHWGLEIGSWLFCAFLGSFLFSIPFLLVHFGIIVGAMYTFEMVPHYFILLWFTETILILIYFFFGSTLELGYIDLNLSLLDQRRVSFSTIFGRFRIWDRALFFRLIFVVMKLISLCIFVIPCLVVSTMYCMTPYILEEKKDYTVYEAMRASRQIMKGHKWELLSIRMSFLGWYILGFLTLGLAFLYAKPYMHMTETVFFNEISGRADAYYER